MARSFYEALGVDRDADAAAIDRAYRNRVKTHHPDVSDSPDAGERFRKLTTARDVLIDEAERARYDELGHDAYLRSEGGRSGWSAPEGGGGDVGSSAAAAARATVARAAASDGGPAGPDPDSPASDPSSTAGSVADAAGSDAAASGAGGTGASYYRPGRRLRPDAAASSMPGPIDVLRAVGPWAVVDLILLTSALATAWMVMSVWSLSPASILLAALLLAVAFCATVFHLSVQVAG